MMKDTLVSRALEYAKKTFETDYSGHDYYHTFRVFKMATYIAMKEGADLEIVQLAALLHDIDDRKLFPGTYKDKVNTRKFWSENNMDTTLIQQKICDIIDEISFAGKDSVTPKTLEGKCVQDADRLDAMGAIGIARAFAYGGNHNRKMHDPDVAPDLDMGAEVYHSRTSTTVNHFYEKLFKLKDMMNTDTARALAHDRETYMREFLAEFFDEWDGNR